MTKAEWRQTMVRRRDELSLADRLAWSAEVCRLLGGYSPWRDAQVAMAYLAMRSELDLHAALIARLAAGLVTAAPTTAWTERQLTPVRLHDLADVVLGRFGVPEVSATRAEPIAPSHLNIVLVPGLAFDRRGYRLGYGAGLYDRFLTSTRADCHVVGVGFGMQVVADLPHDDHDVRLDALCTEEGVVEFGDE